MVGGRIIEMKKHIPMTLRLQAEMLHYLCCQIIN